METVGRQDLAPDLGASAIRAFTKALLDDLRALARLPVEAAIVGKALYEGCFTLSAALAAVAESS